MKICRKCEAINADSAQFCCKCGSPLGASQHTGGGYQPQPGGYQPQPGGYQPQSGGYQPQPSGYQPQPSGYQPQSQYRSTSSTMGFGDAIRVCMKEKYASFEGRATRAEYWYFYLFSMLIMIGGFIGGAILGAIFTGGDEYGAIVFGFVVYFIVSLVFCCPGISVLVRRLHDTGRSGWWWWIAFIPYIGGIVLFIFTLLSSQEHDNEYGPYVRY